MFVSIHLASLKENSIINSICTDRHNFTVKLFTILQLYYKFNKCKKKYKILSHCTKEVRPLAASWVARYRRGILDGKAETRNILINLNQYFEPNTQTYIFASFHLSARDMCVIYGWTDSK